MSDEKIIEEKDGFYIVPKNVFTEDYVRLYEENIRLKIELTKSKEKLIAYERQLSKQKPNEIETHSNGWKLGHCCVCDSIVTSNMNYCDKCGQHILWEDKNEKQV